MHPVFRDVYNAKKTTMEQFGAEQLAKEAAGGSDLATILSKFNGCFQSPVT